MADPDFIWSSMQKMGALFEGLSREETKQLLAALERSGAGIYRSLAEDEQDAAAKAALLRAAGREIENAEVLEGQV